jgi:hypothetical protein
LRAWKPGCVFRRIDQAQTGSFGLEAIVFIEGPALEPGWSAAARHGLDHLESGGAAVECNGKLLRLPVVAACHQYRALHRTDAAFDVVVQVQFSGVLGMVVLPEHEQSTFGLQVQQSLGQAAMALAAAHLHHACILGATYHTFQKFAAVALGQGAALLVQRPQLLQQRVLGVHPDAAAVVRHRSAFRLPVQHMQELQRNGQALRRPGCIVTDADRIRGPVDTGNHFVHGSGLLNGP